MNATSAPRHPVRTLIASSLIVSLLGLSACNKNDSASTPSAPASDTGAASAPQPASTPVAYTPPSADQLYQMVAPIALFPDKLVALVLAGATYPDQIAAANTWVGQNPSLKGQALATAADTQPWDPSVKALTAFPAVLAQMASNPAWTTALGQAYYNDPTDVMNAIQVMRQRAQASGHLRSGSQLHVTQVAPAAPANYAPSADAPVVYSGPAIIPPPEQAIEIEPAQPDVVYVPSYNPTVVYGEPVSSYPGYVYQPPAYTTGEAVAAGVVTFGIGIAVGAAIFGHHDWGWHAWGMNWGAPHQGGPDRHDGWQRPAVVYNHTTYVTKSTTVVNNVTNIRNTRITNNYGGNVTNNNTFERNGMRPGSEPPREQAMRPSPGAAPMTMPHFGANDTRPGARPAPNAFEQNRENAPHADASGRQAPGGQMHAQQAMQQEREQAQQRNEAQQQQQRNAMQQQREEMQQHNEAQQQQQREQMQQHNAAQQQQQRAEMQQHNEAQQQQQRAEMQQRNEAQQQQQRAEMQQRNEAQQQQQQRAEMQQRNEAQQQQQRREMQPHAQPQPQEHAAPQPRQPEPAQHHSEQPQQQHDPHEHRPE
ncbi:DUF3300 domain-containing protein [Burkholderia sp. JKS000303]|uniref:DUF3300 domain-containing protein n=1 Tax=Burkholderia sp. JKS000303 TaxID=1938747 RepID=UPI000BF82E96|nr:DUF3300 domain-containing protein [Burkholderia sp. JKS000303]PFH30470.1 uncharacterized protein DUF3300 [Burkholderia sp. JKS000303]